MTAFTLLKLRNVPRSVWRIGLALGAIMLGTGLISACSDPERYRAPWCSNFGDGGVYECSYNSFEQWTAEGEKRTEAKATEVAAKWLNEYEAPPLDPAIDEALGEFVAKKKATLPDSFS